jgi:hypothetical protein
MPPPTKRAEVNVNTTERHETWTGWFLGATPANQRGPVEPEPNEAALSHDADYAAWVDAHVEAAIAMQDDAEWHARRFGPEPEFMLAVGMDDGR